MALYDTTKVVRGWYTKPHSVLALTQERRLTKSEYILFDVLFACENRYTNQPNQWFFVTDKKICQTHLISPRSLIKARRELQRAGLIEVQIGHSHSATLYRIPLDGKSRGYFRAKRKRK